MKLKQIHHYDTYVPILSGLSSTRNWKQAVNTVITSLRPLGDDYCRILADRASVTVDGATVTQTGASRAGRSVAVRTPPIRTS